MRMFLACLALCAISGCAATSDRSDVACDEPNVITSDAGLDADAGDLEVDATTPVRVRPVYPEDGACYPTICGRGLREFGPCACPEIETACRAQYGAGYERTCPALRTWAASCLDANGDASTPTLAELRCYPQSCTELREDGGMCSCRAVMSACLVAHGEDLAQCPALKGWARACLAP